MREKARGYMEMEKKRVMEEEVRKRTKRPSGKRKLPYAVILPYGIKPGPIIECAKHHLQKKGK
jgi:hypothetical protein